MNTANEKQEKQPEGETEDNSGPESTTIVDNIE